MFFQSLFGCLNRKTNKNLFQKCNIISANSSSFFVNDENIILFDFWIYFIIWLRRLSSIISIPNGKVTSHINHHKSLIWEICWIPSGQSFESVGEYQRIILKKSIQNSLMYMITSLMVKTCAKSHYFGYSSFFCGE